MSIFLARVNRKTWLNTRVIEFEFEGVSEALPPWSPGSHIALHLPNGLIRQYSLLPSWRVPGRWRIAVLIEPEGRGGSNYLAEFVREGDHLKVGAPRNHFPFEFDSPNPVVFVGAGIGVTPLISMAEEAARLRLPLQFHYLAKSDEDLVFLEELQRIAGESLFLYKTSAQGRPNLKQLLPSREEGAHVFACGPETLLREISENCAQIGRLHVERFAPIDTEQLPNHTFMVLAEKTGIEFVVPEDESIFVAAEFEGIFVPGDCLEGTCGTCETLVIEGEVEHRDSVLSDTERQENKSMMICVSRAKSETLRLDL